VSDSTIDRAQVGAILRATLRRATRGKMLSGRSGKPRGLVFLLIMYAALGFVIGLVAFGGVNVFTFSLLIFAYTFLTAGMTLVAESSTLLFDARENDILGHRPVHPRTLFLAKTLGMLTFAALVCAAINVAPMITGLWCKDARWWYPAAHLLTLAFLVLFSASTVVFVYALLARLVSRRTFDTVASWAQVAVQAVLIISYQLVPRLIDRFQDFRLDSANAWLLVLPPTWFAALEDLLMGHGAGPRTIALSAAAVLVTPLIFWAALRYLAGDWARQIAALGETPVAPRPEARARRPSGFAIERLFGPWLRDPVERGSFRLAAAYLTRDRDVRMRIYPSLATILVFAVIAIVDRKMGPHFGSFMSIFLAGTLPATVMMTFKMSPEYAASDVFRYTPIAGTASVFHGVRKAVLVLLVIPSLVVASAILWFGLPDHTSLRLVLPALLAMPTLSLMDGLAGDYIPLSLPPTGGRQGAINVMLIVAGLVWNGLLLGGAFFADSRGMFWPMVGVEIAALAIVHPLLLRGIRVRTLRREGE
jgi:ABC-2 type transport system permease protein